MPHADSVVSSRHAVAITHRVPLVRSYRVARVQGMFDMPAADEAVVELAAELRLDECTDWQIGAIVGASGSGKTSVARHVFGHAWQPADLGWRDDVPIIDDFPVEADVDQITRALTAVGLSSAPAWLRPYRVLSTGEQFRAGLARMLVEPAREPLVIDEYTSVVDRTVAKAVSVALERTARGWYGGRVVVVSCHKDFVPWLQPDWLLDLDTGDFDPKAGGRASDQASPYASTVASATRGECFAVRTI